MEQLYDFLSENYKWLFSGLGVVFLGLLARFIIGSSRLKTGIYYKDKTRTKVESRNQRGGITANTVGDINIVDADSTNLKAFIEKYIEDLEHIENKSGSRIDQLPVELYSQVQMMLKSHPMSTSEMAMALGLTDKMMDNILNAMVDKGLLDFDGYKYTVTRMG